jgi:hypothetical protein
MHSKRSHFNLNLNQTRVLAPPHHRSPLTCSTSDWRNMSLYAHVEHMNFSAFERLIPGTTETYGSKVWYL